MWWMKKVTLANYEGMSEEELKRALQGMNGHPIVKGILQLLDRQLALAIEGAIDPRLKREVRDDSAGQANGLIDLKAEIETMTGGKQEKTES